MMANVSLHSLSVSAAPRARHPTRDGEHRLWMKQLQGFPCRHQSGSFEHLDRVLAGQFQSLICSTAQCGKHAFLMPETVGEATPL